MLHIRSTSRRGGEIQPVLMPYITFYFQYSTRIIPLYLAYTFRESLAFPCRVVALLPCKKGASGYGYPGGGDIGISRWDLVIVIENIGIPQLF